jgi:hypothetical protein
MGQRVLSIRSSGGKLEIRAGIHTSDLEPHPVSTQNESGGPLSGASVQTIKEAVEEGIAARQSGKYHKPDEHWLQAVIRRDPTIVGVEQPVLRELPAWRPVAKPNKSRSSESWGRGFIDLVGVDGHEDLRVVETKLAANKDELLFLQGLDYYIWSLAYQKVLRDRLGAPKRSEIVVHYVIGATPEGAIKLSEFAAAQAAALDIPWRLQTVTDWYRGPDEPGRSVSELLPPGKLPP